ncbi:tyrosine-type recombinase/integrase [Actinobacillus equuli subsp. haemolyticus]|uniref:tyrosine-type recombinase/integrase n=1 Tax=Actinobacillus equuli TaxID=718 RepID=UPI0024465DCF|nr:tyrosine-type recombinase/integrase [Actinobacillus equuli]WGE51324.1 tyrosine-type recombinase/integrase [Actinobacillus equuli subsp. haemolyticus]
MAIKNYPLNDTQIKNLKPQTSVFQVSDGSSGLLLRIYPSGVKSWIFSYIHPVTRKRITKKSFGKYPEISLAQARKIRDEFKSLLVQGIDPYEYKANQLKAKEKEEETLETLAYKWIEWKAEKDKLKEDTKKKTIRRLEIHLFPRFKNYRVTQIEISDCIEKLKDLQANHSDILYRVIGNFIEIMTYARFLQLVKYNPIADLKQAFSYQEATHQPTITPQELSEFLKELDKSDRKYETKLLVKWQLLTILRPAEAVAVEWSEIDWENKILTLPAEKMKGGKRAHRVALNSQALAILEEMKKFNGHRRFIFCCRVNRDKPANSQTVNNAIKKMSNGKYRGLLVAHGLRSIASTYLHERFTTEYHVVEACLAHVDINSVKTSYHRGDYLERRFPIMQAWGDFVESCE